MQYIGGKSRIGKQIAQYLEANRKPGQQYLEPFCGACNVLQYLNGPRFGYDINPHLIELWKQVINGSFQYPVIDEEAYKVLQARKNQTIPDPLLAFAGFGCSFGGKWFGGFARNNERRNYCVMASNSLKKKALLLQGAVVNTASYLTLTPEDCLIYADPPYRDTTGYSFSGKFNHLEFWDRMRVWAKTNTVFVSEYSAPYPFVKEVQCYPTKINLHSTDKNRIERLFKVSA